MPGKRSVAMIKRVLLISPHKISYGGYKDLVPPLGVAYIAAVLEKARYKVKILDVAAEDFNNEVDIGNGLVRIGLSYERIEREIRAFSPDVVGVSCLMSLQFQDTVRICSAAKRVNPATITILGGEHPSAFPKDCLKRREVDYVIIGEGEYSTLELLSKLMKGEDISGIDGLGYKKWERIHINPKTEFIEDLDKVPLPARHLLPMQTYFKVNTPQAGTSLMSPNTSILTSRGCSARCIFCAATNFWGNRFRGRSARMVVSELIFLKKEYGIKEISFIDDNLTQDKRRAKALFQAMIDSKLDIVWNTPQGLAAWSLDKELLWLMKRSGCYEVTFAIESGDQRVLDRIIKKPLHLSRVEPLVKEAKRLGLMTKGFFVVGLPGETKVQMQRTFELARRLRLDSAGVFVATPLPGTELYRICKKKGYLNKDFSFERVNYAKGYISTPDFGAREVESLVSRNMLILNISLAWRSPLRFLKKYSLLLWKNPKVLIDYALFLFKKGR